MLRKYKKAVKEYQNLINLKFPVDMYNNVYGSIIICACMFSTGYNLDEIIRKWKQAKRKNKITWGIDDEKFIEKTLEYFEIKRPEYFPIAFVQSRLNCLFAPYNEDEKTIYPLREDGLYSRTLEEGKIYPINFE